MHIVRYNHKTVEPHDGPICRECFDLTGRKISNGLGDGPPTAFDECKFTGFYWDLFVNLSFELNRCGVIMRHLYVRKLLKMPNEFTHVLIKFKLGIKFGQPVAYYLIELVGFGMVHA